MTLCIRNRHTTRWYHVTCLGNVSKVSCDFFFFFPSSRAWSDMCVDGVCLSVFIPVMVRPVSSKATLLPDALTLVPHTVPARPSERLRRTTERRCRSLRGTRAVNRECACARTLAQTITSCPRRLNSGQSVRVRVKCPLILNLL